MRINYLFWQRFFSVILILLFSQPYLAELSFKQGKNNMLIFNVESAVENFELARRLTPYNSEYYYQEAVFWNLAAQHGKENRHAATRADNLFMKGLEVNPFDVKNLLSRAIMHRDYPAMFDKPVSKEEILEWFDYILYWRPAMEIAQYEYIKTLKTFEKESEAALKLKEFLKVNPNADLLLELVNTTSELR